MHKPPPAGNAAPVQAVVDKAAEMLTSFVAPGGGSVAIHKVQRSAFSSIAWLQSTPDCVQVGETPVRVFLVDLSERGSRADLGTGPPPALIVVGASGTAFVRRYVLGPVADYGAHHSQGGEGGVARAYALNGCKQFLTRQFCPSAVVKLSMSPVCVVPPLVGEGPETP